MNVKRLFLALMFLIIMAVSLFAVVTATPPSERQRALISEAEAYLADGIYIFAMPLLQEASAISSVYIVEAQTLLKQVYLTMGDNRSYIRLLDEMMASPNATPAVFIEAAEHFVYRRRLNYAFDALRTGLARFNTSDDGFDSLDAFYESIRYAFELSRSSFDDVTLTYNGFIQVKRDGLWGLATYLGTMRVPYIYDSISTVSQNRAVAKSGDVVQAIDLSNRRIALLREPAQDIGNLSSSRIPLMLDDAWVWSTEAFDRGQREYEALGMYAGGFAVAKMDGRWGLIDLNQNAVIPFEHDGIVTDELGRAVQQNAVFIRENNGVTLFINNRRTNMYFEDARPFSSVNYAAVKQNGLWGFINAQGQIIIQPQFEEARSFSQHLAAVRKGQYWGYVSLRGEVVIEPMFLEARDFYNGSAPVLTEQGWRFITLLEYRRRVGL